MNHSAGTWSSVEIAGKSADVYQPAGEAAYEAAVLFLHDDNLATPVHDLVFTQLFDEFQLPCLCPHGGQSWWLDVVCSSFDADVSPMKYLIRDVLPWMESRWNVMPPTIGLLGVGMGGQGALQLAYRQVRTFPVVAAIAPMVDFHMLHGEGRPLDEMFCSAEAARQQTATLHLHPLNWPPHQLIVCDPADLLRYDGCERLTSKLSSIGIPFDADLTATTSGEDQEYLRLMAPQCVSFVAQGLQKIRNKP